MKKLFSTILLFLIVTTCTNCNNHFASNTDCNTCPLPSVSAEQEISEVYITATGSKYHKEDCRYLKYTKCKISLADAKNSGFLPCSVCNP